MYVCIYIYICVYIYIYTYTHTYVCYAILYYIENPTPLELYNCYNDSYNRNNGYNNDNTNSDDSY